VAQDAYVYDGTVRENLLLAAPCRHRDQAWEALAAAALNDTVAAFAAGLTRVSAQAAKRSRAGSAGSDPDAAIVIALHGRQSPVLSWTPSARIDLDAGRFGGRVGGAHAALIERFYNAEDITRFDKEIS
jgi:ABC-type transport system involved in cytochrome bd biosynthesis fused ATPase/permease subunit